VGEDLVGVGGGSWPVCWNWAWASGGAVARNGPASLVASVRLAVAKVVTRIDSPREPPTCWLTFSRLAAAPVWWGGRRRPPGWSTAPTAGPCPGRTPAWGPGSPPGSRSATLSCDWPRFRNELASWITARRRRSPVSPWSSASRYRAQRGLGGQSSPARRPLEARDTAVGGQLGSELLDQRQELRLASLVDGRPGVRYPLLPFRFVHQRSLSDLGPCGCPLSL
jgi:hypothetical protein